MPEAKKARKKPAKEPATGVAKEAARKAGDGPGASESIEAAALYVVVFVCGTVLMAAEMTWSRLLAPYFGSAVFVWGSLIGVVMLALSAGYYAGGRLADRRPSFRLLCAIAAAAGAYLCVMPLFSDAVCGAIEAAFPGPRAGPLLSSMILFLIPSVLLATVTPFAVRLSAKELTRVGNVAGRLSALSTVGSVVGTLSAAFVLIMLAGSRMILLTLGVTLLVTAAWGLATTWTGVLRNSAARFLVESPFAAIVFLASLLGRPGPSPRRSRRSGDAGRAGGGGGETRGAGPAAGGAGKKRRGASEKVEAAALYTVVFVCGTILMALEIAGSRILAPYFGSAIFVWGSLIGVVMIALAAGYYAGGRIADRRPSFPLLVGLIAAAGLFLLLMPAFSNAVCGAIETAFKGPRAGPLLSSVVLFIVPAVLLATVTPFAVRLSARDLARIGNVAGRLSALSTVGSIAGTLSAAFVLITLMGTRKLVFALGAALLVTAAVALAAAGRKAVRGSRAAALAGVAALLVLVGYLAFPRGPGAELSRPWEIKLGMEHELAAPDSWSDSNYHLIIVTEQSGYKDPDTGRVRKRRVLRFNDRVQSAIYIDTAEKDPVTGREVLRSYESAVGYTDILHMGLIFRPSPKRVLVVGCGGGIAPTEFTRHYGAKVDVIEIDPEVERTSRRYFHVDDRVTFHIGDGRRVLSRLDGGYDLIILDAYSSGGYIPPHLTTVEFLALCRGKLGPGGVVVSNVISALDGKSSDFYQSEYITMHHAGFRQVYTFPRIPSRAEAERRGRAPEDYWKGLPINIIVVASQDETRLSRGEIVRRARRLTERDERRVRVRNFVHHASRHWEHPWEKSASREEMLPAMREGMKKGILLTDDYCPVDLMFLD